MAAGEPPAVPAAQPRVHHPPAFALSRMQRLANSSLLCLIRLSQERITQHGLPALGMSAGVPPRGKDVQIPVSWVFGRENRGYNRRLGAMRGVGTGLRHRLRVRHCRPYHHRRRHRSHRH